MKLPINLDKLLKPLSLFLLFALLITGAIYAVLNDEQRAKEAANLQKDILSAIPSALNGNTQQGVTWTEAGKELLALEESRKIATDLFQTRVKKSVPKTDAPNPSENQALKALRAGQAQPIVVADPTDAPPSPITPTPVKPKKPNGKKIKKRKLPACCRCTTKKVSRKKC